MWHQKGHVGGFSGLKLKRGVGVFFLLDVSEPRRLHWLECVKPCYLEGPGYFI